MQIGSFWEAFRADAAWLREVLGSTRGRRRARLGLGAGFPLKKRAFFKYLVQQHDRDIVVVRETGSQAGAVRERAVSLVLEGGKRPASRWFAWARKPSSGKAPRRPRGTPRSDVAPASID